MYKKCKSCDTWKPFENFYRCKKAADKHQTHCKLCKSEKAKVTKKQPLAISHKTCNKCDQQKEISQFRLANNTADGYRPECKPCKYEIDKQYRSTNPHIKREESKRYAIRYPEKVLAKTRKYQAAKYGSLPDNLSKDDLRKIEEFYALARTLTDQTGIPHEVDHIIPLQGREVKGKHEPSNLRVVTREENRKKSNKLT